MPLPRQAETRRLDVALGDVVTHTVVSSRLQACGDAALCDLAAIPGRATAGRDLQGELVKCIGNQSLSFVVPRQLLGAGPRIVMRRFALIP